jgi:hypothetical protein
MGHLSWCPVFVIRQNWSICSLERQNSRLGQLQTVFPVKKGFGFQRFFARQEKYVFRPTERRPELGKTHAYHDIYVVIIIKPSRLLSPIRLESLQLFFSLSPCPATSCDAIQNYFFEKSRPLLYIHNYTTMLGIPSLAPDPASCPLSRCFQNEIQHPKLFFDFQFVDKSKIGAEKPPQSIIPSSFILCFLQRPKTQDLSTKSQFGKKSPQKTSLSSRNPLPRSRTTPEKPRNPLVTPEGTKRRSSKNAQKQAFFAPPASRVLSSIGNNSNHTTKLFIVVFSRIANAASAARDHHRP